MSPRHRKVDPQLVVDLGRELVAGCMEKARGDAIAEDGIRQRMRAQADLVKVAGLSMPAAAALGERLLVEAGWSVEQVEQAGVKYGGVRRAVDRVSL